MTQITHAARKKTIISQTSLESCILLPCVLYLHRQRKANMNKTAAGLGSLQMEDVTVPQPLLLGQVLIKQTCNMDANYLKKILWRRIL